MTGTRPISDSSWQSSSCGRCSPPVGCSGICSISEQLLCFLLAFQPMVLIIFLLFDTICDHTHVVQMTFHCHRSRSWCCGSVGRFIAHSWDLIWEPGCHWHFLLFPLSALMSCSYCCFLISNLILQREYSVRRQMLLRKQRSLVNLTF